MFWFCINFEIQSKAIPLIEKFRHRQIESGSSDAVQDAELPTTRPTLPPPGPSTPIHFSFRVGCQKSTDKMVFQKTQEIKKNCVTIFYRYTYVLKS
jgi:hypothetical protein